jgi:hypothetical protein
LVWFGKKVTKVTFERPSLFTLYKKRGGGGIICSDIQSHKMLAFQIFLRAAALAKLGKKGKKEKKNFSYINSHYLMAFQNFSLRLLCKE